MDHGKFSCEEFKFMAMSLICSYANDLYCERTEINLTFINENYQYWQFLGKLTVSNFLLAVIIVHNHDSVICKMRY